MQPEDVIDRTRAIYEIGAAFYFTPETVEHGKQHLGLDGFRFYFLGRGGVLGDVDADVVRSAFGYFAPELIRRMWSSAVERSSLGPRDAARAYIACAHGFGRKHFADVPGLDGFVDAASTVIGAVEGAGLALFAGVRAEPVPDDPAAAAMHQAMVLRELRGSVHLLAHTAVGLPTALAHAIRRPGDVEMFGYPADLAETVTDHHRQLWQRAEDLTNEILAPAYAALSEAQAEALVAGTEAMAAALAG